jgi:hypothetical protein
MSLLGPSFKVGKNAIIIHDQIHCGLVEASENKSTIDFNSTTDTLKSEFPP